MLYSCDIEKEAEVILTKIATDLKEG